MHTHLAGVSPLAALDERRNARIYARIGWRIVPPLLLAFMIDFLDRINLGYAQLQMKQTLPFGDAVYALGAGIFFLGYLLFEVPSNLILMKIGVRRTLLRIMVLWGLTAAALAFVATPAQFYFLRFLLGVFEAGFFPGVILYFTFWFPSARRGQVIAIIMAGAPLMNVLAGPLCGATLKFLDGVHGLHGWQWLFVVQGLPATFLGVFLFFWLDDRPDQARWLGSADKELLRLQLEADRQHDGASGAVHPLASALREPRLYLLAGTCFLMQGAGYALVFWLPTLIQSWGVQDVLWVGIYAAIPYAVGVLGSIGICRSSDRWLERRRHFVLCMALAVIGLGSTTVLSGQLAGSLAALSVAMVGLAGSAPIFWTAVTEHLPKPAAAAGIALVNSLGALGPTVSPYANTLITQATGDARYSMYMVIAAYLVSAVTLWLAVRSRARR